MAHAQQYTYHHDANVTAQPQLKAGWIQKELAGKGEREGRVKGFINENM